MQLDKIFITCRDRRGKYWFPAGGCVKNADVLQSDHVDLYAMALVIILNPAVNVTFTDTA